jgi:acyl-CoA thioester hydrolase
MRDIETYRGFVYPWSIDHVGHMNVQSYVGRFDEASWHFLARLGLTPSLLAEQGRGLVALDQRIQYRREVLAGSLLHISSALLDARAKTLRYVHRMRNSETHEEVATMELLVGYLDKATRRTVALPDAVAARAQRLLSPDMQRTMPCFDEPAQPLQQQAVAASTPY